MTEFNLSDKIDYDVGMIETHHVKEFIRLLKEKLTDNNPTDTRLFMICQADILDLIDKLAGEKLK